MKIKVGKKYWRRDGLLSGTIIPGDSPFFPFKCSATLETYNDCGMKYNASKEDEADLLAEYTEKTQGDDLPDPVKIDLDASDADFVKELRDEIEDYELENLEG